MDGATVLADVSFSTEGLIVIGALMTALSAAVSGLFKLLLQSKDYEIARIDASRHAYRQMAEEATSALEKVAARHAENMGVALPEKLAPVVPEHQSPVTAEAQLTAETSTLRARLTAAILALGLPPRTVAIIKSRNQA